MSERQERKLDRQCCPAFLFLPFPFMSAATVERMRMRRAWTIGKEQKKSHPLTLAGVTRAGGQVPDRHLHCLTQGTKRERERETVCSLGTVCQTPIDTATAGMGQLTRERNNAVLQLMPTARRHESQELAECDRDKHGSAVILHHREQRCACLSCIVGPRVRVSLRTRRPDPGNQGHQGSEQRTAACLPLQLYRRRGAGTLLPFSPAVCPSSDA